MPPEVPSVCAASVVRRGHRGAPAAPLQSVVRAEDAGTAFGKVEVQQTHERTFLEQRGEPCEPQTNPSTWGPALHNPPSPPSDGVHLNTPKPQCCPVPHPSTGQCPPPHAPFPPFGWGQVQPLVNPPSLMAPGGRFGARIRRAGGLSAFPQQRRGETLGAGQPSHAPGRPLPSASPGTKRHALFRLCSRGPSIES